MFYTFYSLLGVSLCVSTYIMLGASMSFLFPFGSIRAHNSISKTDTSNMPFYSLLGVSILKAKEEQALRETLAFYSLLGVSRTLTITPTLGTGNLTPFYSLLGVSGHGLP